MDQLLELFHSDYDDDILDVDLQIIQYWLLVAPSSKFYTVSNVLFHKDEGANVTVTNCMSNISMFFSTKSTVKLANGNTGHDKVIGAILCHFPNWSIIYPLEPVYYFPCDPSNTISSCALKFYVGFQRITSEPLEHFLIIWPSILLLEITPPDSKQYRLSSNINLQSQPSKKKEYFGPNCMCYIKTESISAYS